MQPTKPVSLDDVIAVLAEDDPHATNAAAIRAALGRGSYATIQKHLDAIRAERRAAAAIPGDASTAPAAPVDAINAIWTTAYAAAGLKVAVRLETLSQERDAAMLAAESLAADVAGLTEALDAAEAANEAAIEALDDEKLRSEAALSDQRRVYEATEANYIESKQIAAAHIESQEREHERLTHELALAKRDIVIERDAHQRTIDNLNAQVADLKALLAQLRPG